MPLTDVLGKIFSSGAGDIVSSIGKVIDDNVTSKEEKEQLKQAIQAEINRHNEAILAEASKELELQVADMANARALTIALQTSEKSSWFSKNVAYLIDAFVTLVWGGLAVYIALRFLHIISYSDNQPDMTIILAFWAGISTQFGTILNFHRGSSVQSRTKDDTIRNLSV